MFEAVRKNRRVAQVIVVLIALPFAFFGMESYFRDTPANTEVAQVAGQPVYAAEFQQALQEQQNRLRQTFGAQVDQALLNSEPLRRSVLDELINQKTLAHYAQENQLTIPLPALQESIAAISAFHDEKGFSMDRYTSLLRAQGMTQAHFEASMRQDLALQQVLTAVGQASIVPRKNARQLLEAQLETRQIRLARFSPDAYLDGVEVSDEAIRAQYESHPERFQEPARIKAQYLVFSAPILAEEIQPNHESQLAWYESNKTRFSTPEQRQARHILLNLEPDAAAADVEAARQKLEALRAELQADPTRFAELARTHSQDPGSATKGGDLGFFGKGVMVPPFEAAAFALEEGQISEPVRTDFGYHLIEITAIRPETIQPFEAVRDEIEKEVRQDSAQRRFSEEADEFSNLVYEQLDRLDEVAARFTLKLEETDWIEEGTTTLGAHPAAALLTSLFEEPLRSNGHNSEAKEVAPGVLIAARVLEHQPRKQKALESVTDAIRSQLALEQGREKAKTQGEATLADLAAGVAPATAPTWEKHNLSRHAKELPPDLLKRLFAFQGNGTQLPHYLSETDPVSGEFVLLALDRIEAGILPNDDPRLKAGITQIENVIAEQEMQSFMASLRNRYSARIHSSAFEEPRP
jgi:peptidyl-prolyl cis-trans isomerase D